MARSRIDTVTNVVMSGLLLGVLAVSAIAARRQFAGREQRATFIRISLPSEYVADGRRLIGSDTAPLRLVEFSDFQCPYCRQLNTSLEILLDRYPGQFAVSFRHLPLPTHRLAMRAAIGSECAAAQGRFSQYASAMFRDQALLPDQGVAAIAMRAGISDSAAFVACLTHADSTRIVADVHEAQRIDIPGTPAIILADELIVGVVPLDSLDKWLRAGGVRPRP